MNSIYEDFYKYDCYYHIYIDDDSCFIFNLMKSMKLLLIVMITCFLICYTWIELV